MKISKNAPPEDGSKKIAFKSLNIELKHLLLDPNNYRFLNNLSFKRKIRTKFHLPNVQETTLRLLELDKAYQLQELKKSILTNGYVPMERIIVVPYEHEDLKDDTYLVVEGNRRVAALKSLLQENEEGVRELTPDEISSFSEIPCAILRAGQNSLVHAERVIMGIRHIAGPKEWGAYQQAQLVLELHDEENEEFSKIGEHLGISAVEVARRYRAMRALKTMENDELYASSSSPEHYRLFHELVSLPDVRKRFGWDDEGNKFAEVENAREFFDLIAPQDENEAKLKTYSDVRKLKFIIGRSKAEAALFDPDRSFSDALLLADAEISEENAKGFSIAEICRDVRKQIEGIKATQLETAKRADLDALARLLKTVQELKKTLEKQLSNGGATPAS